MFASEGPLRKRVAARTLTRTRNSTDVSGIYCSLIAATSSRYNLALARFPRRRLSLAQAEEQLPDVALPAVGRVQPCIDLG